MTKVVALCSGGMDSVTLAYMLAEDQEVELHLLAFNYGQRHKRELHFSRLAALALGCKWDIIQLKDLGELLTGSALTDDIDVPEGNYADANMRLTVVPNRNSIMLSIAVGIAIAEKASYVAAAMHAGDHPVYPDCRPTFVSLFSQTMQIANEGFTIPGFTVEAPFINMSKAEIVKLGSSLKNPVDYSVTWSCYAGRDSHCGRCGTCVERAEAFHLAQVEDPTQYEDPNFWRSHVDS